MANFQRGDIVLPKYFDKVAASVGAIISLPTKKYPRYRISSPRYVLNADEDQLILIHQKPPHLNISQKDLAREYLKIDEFLKEFMSKLTDEQVKQSCSS